MRKEWDGERRRMKGGKGVEKGWDRIWKSPLRAGKGYDAVWGEKKGGDEEGERE